MKQTLFIVSIIVFCTALLELGLRAIYFHQNNTRTFATTYYYRLLESQLYRGSLPLKQIGIWEFDAVFGYRHKPDTRGKHTTPDFSVTYTIGPDRGRIMPLRESPRGEILILGGSYAFGHGVEDHETFSYVVAETVWKDWQVHNQAVTAWGTGHALLMLKKVLASANAPELVLYAFIPDHLHRNYLRESWVTGVSAYSMGHPHFELENGALQYRGVAFADEAVPLTMDLLQAEEEITKAQIAEMRRLCAERRITFVMVLLPGMEMHLPEWMPLYLQERGIKFLDLSGPGIPEFSTNDGHPSVEGHAIIAERIGASFIPGLLGD